MTENMEHLVALAGVAGRNRDVVCATLHEATGGGAVSPGRVAQLRRLVDELHVAVRRLEEGMDEEDAPIVREDDVVVDRVAELRQARG